MEVSKNTQHWISPNALTIGLNFGGMPDYIQVSVLANAVILSYIPGIIGFDAAHNYRSWNLTAFNTHLSSASSHYVYARLDANGKDALIVYDTEERNIYGATDDNPEFVDNEHYYIYIGRLSSNYNSSTLEKQQRTWEEGPYFGSLSTDQYNNEELTGGWSKLFQWDEITDKIIFLKPVKDAIIDRLNVVREFIFGEKTITGIHDSTDLSSEDHTPDDEHLATSAYISEISDKKYIRKDKDDYTPFTLTVKRLIANIFSVFEGGLQIGEQYVEGMTGVGGNIDEMANAELESLKLRSFLEVPELRFNRVDVVGGELWNAVAFGLIERVDTENQIAYLRLVDGELSGIHANDICRGIFHNLTGNSSDEKEDDCGFLQLAGYSTSYFTPTTIRSNDSFAYSLRAGTSVHPCAGMKFAVYGSFTDKDRQHSAYHTRGYTRYLKGVNTWQIVPDRNIASQFGKIEGLTIGSMTMKGYGSFQDNCYFTGANIQFSKETLDELKGQDAYTAVLTDYEGVVKVDNEGNIQGSMEEQMNVTTNEYNVTANSDSDNVTATRFRLTTSVQAFHGSQQLYYSDAVRPNAFTIRTDAFGCEAGVENGLVYISKIDTSVPSHYVNVYINCEGNVNFLQVFTVTAIEIGDSPVTIDLDNEMVSLSSDDKGNVTLFPAEGIYTRGTLWYGNTEMYVDEVYAEVPSGISYNILLTSHRYADLEVTGVSQSAADCNILRIHMIGRMSETHERQYERVAEFTVNKVKMGENAVYYSLKPSVSSVKIADDRSYSASSVSCAVQKNDGSSASILSSLGENLRMDYSVDGGSFSTYSYGSSVSTDGIEKSVTFRLYWLDEDSGNWILIDREDVPFVSDGTNPVFCDLDNEMAAVAADEDGNVTGTSTVSTIFSMYGGNKKLTLSALSVTSAPSGITTSTDRSSGKVTVTVSNSAANRNVISISGSAVFQGVTETRSIDFIVSKLRTGKDAVVYQLNPSNNAISVDAAGSYTPGYISCNLLKTKGTEPAIETSVVPSGYSVYYSVDGGTEKSYTLGSSLSVSSVKTMIRFVLYYMGDRVDVETIPVAADGNGIASVIVYYMRTETNSQPSSSASGWRTYSDGTAPKPDETYRYVWKKTVTNYKDGSQTVYIESAGAMGADGVSPNASYKSTAFTRTNLTPSTPSGGSYESPVPTTSGWSDGIPDGDNILWASTRIFSSDGKSPQEDSWTTPRQMTDTADFDVEFSSVVDNPGTPTSHPSNWSNSSSSLTIWMATRTKSNGVWSSWQVSKIKGEKGEDGTSIKISGSLTSESELPAYPSDPSDCYIIGGDLYVWNGDSWVNAGQFKGDKGDSAYVHIKYANSLTVNDWTGPNGTGEEPGPYIGIYCDHQSEDQLVWDYYTWTKWKGEDGWGYEYIYKLTETNESPSTPYSSSSQKLQDGYIPSGWSDDPAGVSDVYPYEWVSYRKKVDNVWSDFSSPSLWATFSKDGQSFRYNLFKNSFFKDLTYWIYAGVKPSIVEGYGGKNALYAKYVENSNNYCDVAYVSKENLSEPLCVNTIYTLSAYVKGTGSLILIIFKYNGVYKEKRVTLNSEWTRIAWTFSLEDVIPDYIGFFRLTQSDSEVYVCMPKLEEGERPTDWNKAEEEYNGTNGVGSYIIDLTNESSTVACDYDGNVVGSIQGTKATVYYGDEEDSGWAFSASFLGCSGNISSSNGTVSVSGMSSDDAMVTITASKSGYASLSAVYTISKVRAGSPGADATIYYIQPSVSVIKRDKDGVYTPTTISCSQYKQTGSSTPVSGDKTIKYKRSSDSAYQPYSGAVTVGDWEYIDFFLFDGETMLDKERVPVVKDGTNGTDGIGSYVLDLSNEASTVSCDYNGNVVGTIQGTKATVYYGGSVSSGWTFSASFSGCSGSIGSSTGEVIVSSLSADDAKVTISASKNGASTMTVVYTISKVRAGSPGADATIYYIQPSVSVIKRDKDGVYAPTTISCSQYKQIGSSAPVSGDKTIKYKRSSDSAYQPYSGAVTVGDWEYIDFFLFDGETMLDKERVPVVKDGTNGSNGDNGDDATSYWFDTPCSVIHFTNTGYPSPSSFVVTMKKKKGEGDSSNCADYYLATYLSSDGSTWTRIAGNSSKGASITVTPSQSTNYVQYRVAAFTSSSFSENTMFMQLVIGVSIDGMDGDGRDGEDGYFPRDRGVWDSSKTYVWNDVYRDKVVYNINGIFYNFIVASKGLSLKSVAPTLGGGTSEGSSDGSWELMSTYRTLVADTLFGDKANIGGFMVNGQEMRSQNEVDGEPAMTINGIRGTLKARQGGGTVFSLDEKGRVTAGIEDGKRIELRSDEKSIGIFGEDGTETTTLSGDSFDDMDSIFAGSGGTISMSSGSRTLSPVTIDGGSFVSGDVVGDDSTTLVGGCELRISISSLKSNITPGSVPSGSLAVIDESSISVYVNSYSDASCTTLTSRRIVVSLNDNNSLSSKVYTVNLGKGYHKLSVSYYMAANKGGTGSVSWGSMTATYAVDFFRSVYFSQGFALGRNVENVIAAIIQSGYMKFTAKSGGYGLDVSSSGVKTMIGSGWSHVPRTVFAARVTVTSATACSLSNCYSFDGNNPTLSCSSEGIYRLTFPSSWSSIGIGYSNSSVQATAFGRYRGGSSAAVCWASVDSLTSSSLTIVTSYNTNTEFDACGFFVELKLIK